ncbi:hypothetical protein AB0876_08645 [Mycobacterium sp. NPDC049093]
MADTKAWSGDAHKAATAMFGRAKIQTDEFSRYTAAVGDALSGAAGPIGSARTALLNKADEIDNTGQLHVSDQWVVLVKGGQMTIEQAAALEKRAQSEQITVNRLLTDVGAADDAAAKAVTAAGQSHGLQLPDPTSLDRLFPGALEPGDEVPNPFSHVGAAQQAILRDADMAETLRETKVEPNYDPVTGAVVSTTTTKYMMDGSRYVTTVDAKPPFPDRSPITTEVHYDKNGNTISTTRTVKYGLSAHKDFAGKTISTTEYANGTVAKLTDWPDGKQTCKVITPEGREADVPLDVLDTPVTTVLGATGKYFGPGVSIASALWGVAVAESDFQRCVASAEGAASVAAGTFVGIGLSEFTPIVSIPAGILAASGGEALGNWIGNTFCPR